MMQFFDLHEAGARKRFVTFVAGFLSILLHKKLGIELSDTETLALATMIVGFIGQSGFNAAKEAEAAGAAAAAEVKTVDDASKALGARVGPPAGLLIALLCGSLLVATPARAEDNPPAEVASTVENYDVTPVIEGMRVPFSGQLVTDAFWISLGKQVADLKAETSYYKSNWLFSVILVGVSGLVLAVATGATVYAVDHK